jgi:hypothetical protein
MKTMRYVYVGAPNSSVAHLTFSPDYHIEGAKTVCGRFSAPRWFYWLGKRTVPKDRTICKKCRK